MHRTHLSTQDDVAAALVADGIPVFAVRGEDSDTFYEHIKAILDTEPHLVFDDGADTTTVLHQGADPISRSSAAWRRRRPG